MLYNCQSCFEINLVCEWPYQISSGVKSQSIVRLLEWAIDKLACEPKH